jgi:hypothetical protein
MTQPPAGGAAAPPQLIFIIRHGEKPPDPVPVDPGEPAPMPGPPFGVDDQGNQDAHSLLPRGWQRSGALAVLFGPALGPLRAGLQTPGTLLSPSYGNPAVHRTYQTIQGLSDRLGIPIVSSFEVGQEPQLAASVVSDHSGVVLICWEHDHVPAIAASLPTSDAAIPQQWPGDRFDVIWTFTLIPGATPVQYNFGQVPQQLLSGDTDTVI